MAWGCQGTHCKEPLGERLLRERQAGIRTIVGFCQLAFYRKVNKSLAGPRHSSLRALTFDQWQPNEPFSHYFPIIRCSSFFEYSPHLCWSTSYPTSRGCTVCPGSTCWWRQHWKVGGWDLPKSVPALFGRRMGEIRRLDYWRESFG